MKTHSALDFVYQINHLTKKSKKFSKRKNLNAKSIEFFFWKIGQTAKKKWLGHEWQNCTSTQMQNLL